MAVSICSLNGRRNPSLSSRLRGSPNRLQTLASVLKPALDRMSMVFVKANSKRVFGLAYGLCPRLRALIVFRIQHQ